MIGIEPALKTGGGGQGPFHGTGDGHAHDAEKEKFSDLMHRYRIRREDHQGALPGAGGAY